MALGWLAAALGATVVGLSYVAADRARQGWRCPLTSTLVGGLLGALADSLAGATIQAGYRCTVCGQPSEAAPHACGGGAVLVRGQRWVTNDVVNLIATATGGAAGALTWSAGPCATLAPVPSVDPYGRATVVRKGGNEHA